VRYRVQFVYREDTGEVELFRVETDPSAERAADHDEAHDRVATELAGVLEADAVVEELPGAAGLPAAPRRAERTGDEVAERPTLAGSDG
jgi:FtsH ternary system domain X3